jgi:DNA-directed RNA polymerase I subunit RPA1
MAAAPAKEVTTKQVAAVRFGFYSEDEVRGEPATRSCALPCPPLLVCCSNMPFTAPSLPFSCIMYKVRSATMPRVRPQVRKLSVVNITCPLIFDDAKVPVKDGLYDPRMGPTDSRDK